MVGASFLTGFYFAITMIVIRGLVRISKTQMGYSHSLVDDDKGHSWVPLQLMVKTDNVGR